jgi:hypothetical protein
VKQTLTILAISLSNFAFSQSDKAIYTSVSSLGAGIGYQQQFHGKFSYDVNINYVNLQPSMLVNFLAKVSQHRITARVNSLHGEASIKWHPWGSEYYGEYERNKFFVRAAISYKNSADYNVYSDFQLKRPNRKFDGTDTAIGRINIDLRTNKIQPYLGVGFQALRGDSRFILNIETGLYYQGKPDYTINEKGPRSYNVQNSTRAKKYLNSAVIYPQLKIAFGYRIPYL